MAYGIEECFTHRAFGEGRQLPDEKPRLERLPRITTGFIDLLPKEIMPREETFLKLQTQIRRTRSGGVAELINQLGLSHVFAHRLPGAEENQGCIDQSAVRKKQLRVAKQLLMAKPCDAFSITLTRFFATRSQ